MLMVGLRYTERYKWVPTYLYGYRQQCRFFRIVRGRDPPLDLAPPTQVRFLTLIITRPTLKKTEKRQKTRFCVTIEPMNPIQQRLLDIAQVENLNEIRRVDLVKRVGCDYPSQITHHLNQLIKHGKLVRRDGRLMPALSSHQGLVRIPVMGEADCGEATRFADGRIFDTIAISPTLLSVKNTSNIYALVARGDSMNKANINGKTIEDGDYVIAEKIDGYMPKNKDIVVSIIGGLANIKRFVRDELHGRLLLLSDSHRADYAPIIISEDDQFQVEAKVVDVVKGIAG